MEKSSFVSGKNITKYNFPFFFQTVQSFFHLVVWNFLSTRGIISFKGRNIPKAEHEISPATESPQPERRGSGALLLVHRHGTICLQGRLHSIPRREYKAIWLMAPVQARKVQRLDLLLIFLQTARTAHCVPFPLTRAALPTALLKKKIVSCCSATVSSLRAPCVWARGENGLASKQSIFSFPDGCWKQQ